MGSRRAVVGSREAMAAESSKRRFTRLITRGSVGSITHDLYEERQRRGRG